MPEETKSEEIINEDIETIEKESVVLDVSHEKVVDNLFIPDKLSVDFSNEGQNNIARKINEIIDYLYAKVS